MTGIDNRQSTIANQRACVVFLGCPKNQVDSEHVLGSLTEAGYTLTTEPRSADLIVITTCAFLQSAVRESEAAIEEALKHKQTSAGKKVVVAGCLVERYGKSLKRRFPAVDLWVPLADMPRLAEFVASSHKPQASSSGQSAICSLQSDICNRPSPSSPAPRPSPRVLSTPPHFAYLKIADGCDNRCSYCMIPDIRGPFHSRPMRDIIAEARDLARAGVKELILVAQDTTLYGTDLRTGVHHKACPERSRRDTKTPSPKRPVSSESASCPSCLRGSLSASGSPPQLARLLEELGKLDGIRWLRLMYTHPAHISEDVIDQFASNPRLCRYIDLPIQHIANHLLDKMNRGYTRRDIELLLHDFHAIPDMHIRTTIIVGLPGETERDFNELLAFVRAARFDRLSCYAYSPEPGTKAARLQGQVSPAVKKERIRRLMLAQAAVSRTDLKKLVGRKLTVLVDALTADTESHNKDTTAQKGYEKRIGLGAAIARTEWDAPEIDGVVRLIGRKISPGRFVTALVTSSSTHDLTARVQ
jgi:ribosomal protein S12 methylthiotransferase